MKTLLIQILIFFIIFNGVFTLFTVTAIYPNLDRYGLADDDIIEGTDITKIDSLRLLTTSLGFTGAFAGMTTLIAVGASFLTHTNPFIGLAYGLMAGVVIDTLRKILSIILNIGTAIGGVAPTAQLIFIVIIGIFVSVLIFLFINDLKRMATGV